MAFKPIIADHLKLIDTSIYKEKWGQLKQSIHKSMKVKLKGYTNEFRLDKNAFRLR